MKTEKIKNRFSKYDKRLITYSLYCYAALVLIGTVAPIVLHIETPMTYYIAISVAFALTYSILLLFWDLEWLKKKNILMLAISTILIIGIMVLSGSSKFMWLIILWICLMPLSLWLASGFRTKSLRYYLAHLGMVLLIIGAICSSVLGKEVFAMTISTSSNIEIADTQIPLSKLDQKGTLIMTLPLTDLVIECSKTTPLPQGGVLVPYVTKPLIMLFWIGCFTVISQPCIIIILNNFSKHKKLNMQK